MDIGRSSLQITLSKVASSGLVFIGLAFFARQIGADDLGVFFLFQAILGIAIIPANLGSRIAIEKRISEGSKVDDVLATGVLLKIALLVIATVPILFFQRSINQYIGAEVALYLVIGIVLQEFGGLMLNVLRGELRVGETASIEFGYTVFWIVGGSVLLLLDFGVHGLIFSVLGGNLLRLIWGYYKISVGFGTPSREIAYSLVDYAKYSIIPEVNQYIHNWMDILILGFFVSTSAVAAYEVAWRIGKPVLLLTSAISTTILPQISSWEAENALGQIEELIAKIFTPAVLFVFPAFFGGLLLSREILGLIFGVEFTTAWLALIVLLAGKIPRAVRTVTGKTLLGLNYPDLVTRASIIDIGANLVLNLILISQFGIVGAAIGTASSMAIGSVIRVIYLSRFINIRVRYDEFGVLLASSIGMFGVLYLAKTMVNPSSIIELVVFIAAGAVVYFLLISIYRPIRKQLFSQVQKFV